MARWVTVSTESGPLKALTFWASPKPVLVRWNKLITLMDGPDAESHDLGPLAWGSRINWRPAVRAECQLTLVPALSRLNISFQRARE